MKIEKTEDGYEFAVVPMSHWMMKVGVPRRLAEVKWAGGGLRIAGVDNPVNVNDPLSFADLEWLRSWSRSDSERFVVLNGPKGRGKSTYAAATMRRCLRLSPRPRWVNWPRLVENVADSWGADTRTADVLLPVISTGFLVIDDFGKELVFPGGSLRDWQLRIAYQLINGRYEKKLPTLITTELDPVKMATKLDSAITSRLVEDGRWIDLSGHPDFRQRKGGKK